MASRKLVLNCKHKQGKTVLDSLSSDTTVDELKATLYSITNILPNDLRVLVGFPPKALNLVNGQNILEELPLKSGETLIIEEQPEVASNKVVSIEPKINYINQEGILLRKVVPANNSCLFTSVDFNISGGKFNESSGTTMRKVIAETVAADKETFNEGVLGKPNKDYCKWILNEEHWGGAIELAVLSKYYGIEIVAVDTQSICIHRFGESENFDNRILVIYDGIHYDPLLLEPIDTSKSIQTIFSTSDEYILQMALEIANEAKASRQFTDVQSFKLKCLVCNKNLTGQVEAQQHAKDSGHINFGEI